ncbi:hypothetical protein PCI56_13210 [Plesiomonas shigelloides subsp. oncorhynchi]|nr:hypothetical protein [Plesiomonas shigelloides]MDA1380548.1 hypothetical protein [Plesiomonas shigelloides]
MCKPDGSAYDADELPTPEELLASRSNVEIVDAVNTLHRMSNGTLEEAEKTKSLSPADDSVCAG